MLGAVATVLAVVCKQMQELPTLLGPAVYRGKDTTHKFLKTMRNERAWPQQCWKNCANGSNIVALRFGDHGTKAKQCWELLVNNVASVCTQPETVTCDNFQHCWMFHVASVCTPCCMLLDVVACCCAKFETDQTFLSQQLPTFLLFRRADLGEISGQILAAEIQKSGRPKSCRQSRRDLGENFVLAAIICGFRMLRKLPSFNIFRS